MLSEVSHYCAKDGRHHMWLQGEKWGERAVGMTGRGSRRQRGTHNQATYDWPEAGRRLLIEYPTESHHLSAK